jgi:hypothetical protein
MGYRMCPPAIAEIIGRTAKAIKLVAKNPWNRVIIGLRVTQSAQM